MIKSSAAAWGFRKLNQQVSKRISPESGIVSDGLRSLTQQATSSRAFRGGLYGGVMGAAGGVTSNDNDMHWYSGAAMGALAGAQISTKGLSGRGVVGGAVGAAYGMIADDTSIMGGAFMGSLGAGAGIRYAKTGRDAFRASKNAMMIESKKQASTMQRAGFGLNAVSQAISRDMGFGWRAGKGRGRGMKTNKGLNKQRAMMKQHGITQKDVSVPKGGFGVQNGIDFDALAARAMKVN